MRIPVKAINMKDIGMNEQQQIENPDNRQGQFFRYKIENFDFIN